jgi:aspartyl-tRNA(Asn)/glutamyl-tRNA(Gln) amidotransferase subunit B
MNSFKFVADGIAAEVDRQIAAYESGEEVTQETRHYDPSSGRTSGLRSKEYADDYRYFPEPDMVPMEPDREWVESLRAELPELPGARVRRLEETVGFDLAEGLVASGRDRLYERVGGEDRRAVANVLMNQFAASGVDPESANPDELAKLIEARDQIPRAAFLEALAASGNGDFRAESYLSEAVIADESELDPVIERILAANEAQVEQYRSGKEGLLGFFVGQVMKETGGRANAKVVNERLRERLSA